MIKTNVNFLNILLTFAVVSFIISGVLLFIYPDSEPTTFIFPLCLFLQIILGVFAIVYSIKKTYQAYQLFIGILVATYALGIMIAHYTKPNTASLWWPLIGIDAGVGLIISGVYKYKKVKFGYLFPSVCLIFLGLWYMLFTFNVIKYSFMSVARYSCPIFFGTVAITLILFFIVQQRHKELAVHDEDQGAFSDEELHLEED